jgi:hypothetical protein
MSDRERDIQVDARDVGRIVKYFVLGTILYSLVFSGSILYSLSAMIGFLIYYAIYPIRSVFWDFAGFDFGLFDFGLNSIWKSADHVVQEVMQDATINTAATLGDAAIVLSEPVVNGIDYSTTIGKIIRALIGP